MTEPAPPLGLRLLCKVASVFALMFGYNKADLEQFARELDMHDTHDLPQGGET